jgi:type IV pilus assembly protein PilF
MRSIIVLLIVLLAGCVSETQPGALSADFDAEEAAKTRVSLGLTYLKNGNYTQAKLNLDKALEYAPRLAEPHYSLAYYYQLVGENARAHESYQMAMKLAPKDADIMNSYGAFLCQQGSYEQAQRYFLKAVNSQQYANSAETYENMALCAQSQGNAEDAIRYLQSALNHQPSRAKSLYLLAEMYIATEQYDLAAEIYKRYEKVARVSAESLWMAIEIAEGQGDIVTARGYGDMLVRMYPDNPLTQSYIKKLATTPVIKVMNKKATQAVTAAPVSEVSTQPHEPKVPAQPAVLATDEQREPSSQAPELTGDDLAQVKRTFHKVQKSENLYRLSLQYNIKMQTLIKWNNLDENGSIQVGQKLWLVPPAQQDK